jgi:hypothetical protein
VHPPPTPGITPGGGFSIKLPKLAHQFFTTQNLPLRSETMKEVNICTTCKHNGKCEHQKRMEMNEVLCCASYDEGYIN